jgi:VPDSG-CTERM motif
MAFWGAILAPSHDARAFAVGIGDSHELGFFWPGIQKKSGDQDRATCVNHLLGRALGAINIANGQVYFRSNHAFESLPAASWLSNGTGRTINLGTGGLYKYLFATYNGYGSEVWYVGNLSGIVTIPFLAGWHSLTGWTLFGTGSAGVPDGGVTVMLLGMALGVLALARRFLMR